MCSNLNATLQQEPFVLVYFCTFCNNNDPNTTQTTMATLTTGKLELPIHISLLFSNSCYLEDSLKAMNLCPYSQSNDVLA